MNGRKRVVVTGYGAVTSLGENGDEVWDAILARRLGYRLTAIPEEKVKARFFGFLEPNRRRLEGLPRSLLKALPEYAATPSSPPARRWAWPSPTAGASRPPTPPSTAG
jgi:3-oxoacyl-[acyl-carrier-protein] synthase II